MEKTTSSNQNSFWPLYSNAKNSALSVSTAAAPPSPNAPPVSRLHQGELVRKFPLVPPGFGATKQSALNVGDVFNFSYCRSASLHQMQLSHIIPGLPLCIKAVQISHHRRGAFCPLGAELPRRGAAGHTGSPASPVPCRHIAPKGSSSRTAI